MVILCVHCKQFIQIKRYRKWRWFCVFILNNLYEHIPPCWGSASMVRGIDYQIFVKLEESVCLLTCSLCVTKLNKSKLFLLGELCGIFYNCNMNCLMDLIFFFPIYCYSGLPMKPAAPHQPKTPIHETQGIWENFSMSSCLRMDEGAMTRFHAASSLLGPL